MPELQKDTWIMQIAPGKKNSFQVFHTLLSQICFGVSVRLALTEQHRNTVRPWNLNHCDVEELLYPSIARMRPLYLLKSFWGSWKIEEVCGEIITDCNVNTWLLPVFFFLIYIVFGLLAWPGNTELYMTWDNKNGCTWLTTWQVVASPC